MITYLPLKQKMLLPGIGILAFTSLLSIGGTAQTPKLRLDVQQSSSRKGLDSLKNVISKKYAEQELAIEQYLRKNPTQKRIFEKNGSVYFLKRIENGKPLYVNTKNRASAQMIGANQLHNGGSVGSNVTGTGMVAGVWDLGQVRATHELLSGRVAMQANQTTNTVKGNDHMTHVTGTMVGKDIANQPSARGIAYNATALNYDGDNDDAEMIDFATRGFIISNHSYGLSNDSTVSVWRFGAYDSDSRKWDDITKNAPLYLPFVAGGNEQTANGNSSKNGFDLMTGTSASKNVVTVGALNGDSTMSDYSNWGPTDDGRFKPDLVAKGTGINSSVYTNDQAYSGSDVSSSGTSYASPAAAATGLLLQQYYNNLTGVYMRSSTLKSLMLHTAFDLGNPGPDYKFGWGLLSADKAGLLIKAAKTPSTPGNATINEYATNPVNNGTDEMLVNVIAKGGEPLKVSLGWVDDPGTEQDSTENIDPTRIRLTYDFDVSVRSTSPTAEVRPWRPMGMANRTANATKGTAWFENDVNNYRQVLIENPVADKTYTIAIRKSSSSPATARSISVIASGVKVASLPIELVTFNAASSGSANLLTWTTADEDPNGEFVIQQSQSGVQFTDIGKVAGKGVASTYSYVDQNPLEPVTFYRLKIKERDGNVKFSHVASVRRTMQQSITVSPNPVTNFVKIVNTKSSLNGSIAILTDLNGKEVKRITIQPVQQVDLSQLNSGVYILKTTDESIKIVKQ